MIVIQLTPAQMNEYRDSGENDRFFNYYQSIQSLETQIYVLRQTGKCPVSDADEKWLRTLRQDIGIYPASLQRLVARLTKSDMIRINAIHQKVVNQS